MSDINNSFNYLDAFIQWTPEQIASRMCNDKQAWHEFIQAHRTLQDSVWKKIPDESAESEDLKAYSTSLYEKNDKIGREIQRTIDIISKRNAVMDNKQQKIGDQ